MWGSKCFSEHSEPCREASDSLTTRKTKVTLMSAVSRRQKSKNSTRTCGTERSHGAILNQGAVLGSLLFLLFLLQSSLLRFKQSSGHGQNVVPKST